jgi:hypothetical protein
VSRVIRQKLKFQTKRRSRKLQLSKQEEMALHMASQVRRCWLTQLDPWLTTSWSHVDPRLTPG